MKGLLVKSKDKISKAGIPQNGIGLVGNITWHSGASWSVGGLRVSDEMHLGMGWRNVGSRGRDRSGSSRI